MKISRAVIGVAFAIACFGASVAFMVAGYSLEVAIYDDAKKAAGGLVHGYIAFLAASAFLVLGLRKTYRSMVGSPIWFVLGAWLAPAALMGVVWVS
ncbi:MAG: hypothetical protein PVI23_13660 [Maricaulaceae bacterium]|jgi:hypothetical protein